MKLFKAKICNYSIFDMILITNLDKIILSCKLDCIILLSFSIRQYR